MDAMKYLLEIVRNRFILGLLAGVGALLGLSFLMPAYYALLARYFCLMAIASNTIPVPAQPMVIYMGKGYHWALIAGVGAVGTVLANMIDYIVFSTVLKIQLLRRIRENPHSQATIKTFKRIGFPALVAGNFIVFSFDLVRLVAIAAEYPKWKYALATFIGRAARYAVLAALGTIFRPPWWALLILTAALALPAIISWLQSRARRKRPAAAGADSAPADHTSADTLPGGPEE